MSTIWSPFLDHRSSLGCLGSLDRLESVQGSFTCRLFHRCKLPDMSYSSFCMIIDHQFLITHLPNMPVNVLKELPCTYDHSLIFRTLQGTVDVHACFADHAVSTTVYIATSPCHPLIGRDLIDGSGLTIQGRGALKPEDQSSVSSPELPPQSLLIPKVCPSVRCSNQRERNSLPRGMSGCSSKRGPVSHTLGALSDSSTVSDLRWGKRSPLRSA